MVELLDWNEFVKYLDELRAARRCCRDAAKIDKSALIV
jgi:hypothetical protein